MFTDGLTENALNGNPIAIIFLTIVLLWCATGFLGFFWRTWEEGAYEGISLNKVNFSIPWKEMSERPFESFITLLAIIPIIAICVIIVAIATLLGPIVLMEPY